MSFPVACLISFVVHLIIAGNILSAVHAAGHRLCSRQSEWSIRSRLLLFYWQGHHAHHIVEGVPQLTPQTKLPFMQTPFSGWVVIMIGAIGITAVTTIAFAPFVTLPQYAFVWTANIVGAMSYFGIYELAHRRTHQDKEFFASNMHRWHHRKWGEYFGMWWWDDILANYWAPEISKSMAMLRDLEDWAIARFPKTKDLITQVTFEGYARYSAADQLRRTARNSAPIDA